MRHNSPDAVDTYVSLPKSPLLRIHAPADLVRPCTLPNRRSSPVSSNIVMAVMISVARRLRAAPGHRRRPRCIKFTIRFQGLEGAVPVWLNPSDNQGIRFLLPQVLAGERWEDHHEERMGG